MRPRPRGAVGVASNEDSRAARESKDGELTFNPPGAPIVFHLKRK